MQERQTVVSVSMVREDLNNLPDYVLPSPYTIQWYMPGDESKWIEIWTAADDYNETTTEGFRRNFGADAELLRQRQCYLYDGNGKAFGTASAWFSDDCSKAEYGRLHWVAIIPEMQGKGLAKPLVAAAMNRMRELGHERAYLTTESFRTRAIGLYSKFGFLPEVKDEQHAAAWHLIQQKLGRGILVGRGREVRSG